MENPNQGSTSINWQGGDDLDDDFVPDDLVAMSEEEDDTHSAGGEDVDGTLSIDEDADTNKAGTSASQAASEKKRKRRAKEKERKAKKRKLAETLEPIEAPSVAAQAPVLVADYISSMQAKTFSKMSSIELADIQIPDRELYNRHDAVDWIQESGPAGGFYHQDTSHPSYSIIAETKIQGISDFNFRGWGSFTSSGCNAGS